MILSCPQCAARYNLPDGAIPAGGRMLKCARCGTQWRAMPEEAPTAAPQPAAPPPSTVTPAPEPAAPVAETPVAEEAASAPQPEKPPLPPTPHAPAPDLTSTARLRRLPAFLSGFDGTTLLVLGGVLLMVMAGLIFWARGVPPVPAQQVTGPDGSAIATLSPTVTLTGLAPVGLQPDFLQLANLTTEVGGQGPSRTLVISGILTNLSSRSVPVPELVVELTDKTRQPLTRWPAQLTDTRLSPQQTTTWQAAFVKPPLEDLGGYRAFFILPATAPSPTAAIRQ